MSCFSLTQRRGCSEILESLSFSNLLALKDTVANKVNAWTKDEAISVILNNSQGAEELLKRKKVLREEILKYLIKHGVNTSTSSDKQQLINDALFYWMKLEMNRKPLTAQTNPHLLGQNRRKHWGKNQKNTESAVTKSLATVVMKSRELEQIRQAEEQKKEKKEQARRREEQQGRQEQILKQAQGPMAMQMNIHMNIIPYQHPPQLVAGEGSEYKEMGKEFCQWFFQLLNSQNPSFGQQAEDWGPQHFWEDAILHLTYCIQETQIEQHQSSASVSLRLLSLVKHEQLLFNPNISQSGIKCAASPHGVVAIAVAGTIHKNCQCVGIFEQVFGLIRTHFCGNNWKIRHINLQVKAFNDLQGITQPSVSVQMPALQAHVNELSALLK
ncbi:LOW QUALITY PROTEIN: uncharacterized protein C3orf38 homolog [Pristis pectinata]|uniref:LOW QUALITY PROTEIN: uncharacterized protein C3orf38 homolog n=1 Tax=Pristis pectinata TaxID=685728 RepID=UPI00223D8045|nr:LOW QUALITY PROTEIN: uncharacterized protein C3orf38 homolog [Pristis pectinata]